MNARNLPDQPPPQAAQQPAATEHSPSEQAALDTPSTQTLPIHIVCDTDVGRERTENQDAWGFVEKDGVQFLIVCDGMGGHNGGSTASRLAVQTIEDVLGSTDAPFDERMDAAICEANRRIFKWARRDAALYGMGTTVVVIAIDTIGKQAWMAHVGDSRGYLLRDNVFQRLTRDHTMVQRLVDDGLLTPEAAENHPHSNIISRSLGGGETVEVEHHGEPIDLLDGDIFLLCSDGLTGMVPEAFVPRYLARHGIDDLPRVLINEANEAGGLDNTTVGLVLVGNPPRPRTDYQLVVPQSLRARPAHETSQTLKSIKDAASSSPQRLTGPAGNTVLIKTPAEGLTPPPEKNPSALPQPGADLGATGQPSQRKSTARRDGLLILVAVFLTALIAAAAVGLLLLN